MLGKDSFCRVVAVFQILILSTAFLPASFAKDKSPLTVYSNATPITINTATGVTAPITASPYSSDISVSGMTGTTTKVEVTLKGVSHTNINDLDLLLVSPTGAKFVFLADGSSFVVVEDFVYTFSDTAATTLTQAPSPGTYRPTSGDFVTDTFPAPAPAAPYNLPPSATFASVFNGADPNGTWQLFAVDDGLGGVGSINSGWSLTVTTSGTAATTFTNPNYIAFSDMLRTSSPYGTTINVAGTTGVISSLKVTLTGLSHARTTDIDVLLVSPNGKSLILLSDAGGFSVSNNITLTFDDAAPTTLNGAPVSGTFQPTDFTGEIGYDTFPTPAPLRPYISDGINQLSGFNGFSPNGDWRLFVVDDSVNNAGTLAGGWSLDITTVPTPPPTPVGCSAPSFSTSSYSTGANPTNLAVADFNNDTKPDVAVTNQVTNDVSILLGVGDGTLGAQNLFSVGSSPYAIAAGKFNADNNFDLAVVNSGSNNVSILLGNGDGTFSAPTNFLVGASPISIAVADFNSDSKQDLAVSNFGGFFTGSVSILLGTGTGGFTAGNIVRTRTQPAFVLATDFSNDGVQDLVVANFGADSISTFLGNGNGTFQQGQNLFTFGSGPVAIEAANFIGNDSFIDLAVANYNADTLALCTGSANGTFSCNGNNTSPGGTNPISITSADYDANGSIDLATALSGSNTVNVLTSSVAVGQNPNAVETADFNGDGKPDMVAANSGSNNVSVLLNSCLSATGNIFDFNGDRRTDFSIFRPPTAQWFIQTLNPNGVARIFARPTDTIVSADYNGDNVNDYAFFRPENGLWHILDTASRPIYFTQFGLAGDIPVPADYDGDGKADIAVWRPSDGNWYVRRSIDNSLQVFAFGMNGDKPVPSDYDGDGKDDIAIYRPSTGVWYIFRSSDSQVFIRQFGIAEDKTVAGDYDGDGKADIAVWRPSTAVWYIQRSSDDDFRAVSWGLPGDVPVVGDYEGDGRFDYAVWRASDQNWYVRKSSDNGGIVYQWGTTGDIPIPSIFVR